MLPRPVLPLLFVLAAGCAPAGVSPASGEPSPTPQETPGPPVLRFTHIDVGQGDATLVEGPSGKTLLIDGGDNGMGDDRVLRVLSERGISALDYVIATHPHADHVGGLDEVLARADVPGGVWDNGDSTGTQAFQNYVAAAAGTSGGRHTIAPGKTFELGSGATATCYAVDGKLLDGTEVATATFTNDRSVVLVVEWGSFRYAIAGDLGGYDTSSVADVETPLAALIGDVDVLRVSHHGSRYSTNPTWLNELSPEVAVISAGNGNDYGHPSAELLGRLTGADPAVGIPPPDVWLTEKGAAPAPFTGTGDVVIIATPDAYDIESSHYDATGR